MEGAKTKKPLSSRNWILLTFIVHFVNGSSQFIFQASKRIERWANETPNIQFELKNHSKKNHINYIRLESVMDTWITYRRNVHYR